MLTRTITCFCVSILGFAPELLSQEKAAVAVRFEVYAIRDHVSGDSSLTDNLWEGLKGFELSAVQGRLAFFTLSNRSFGDVKLRADEKQWTWDGKARAPRTSRIETLASPSVTQYLGNSFDLSVTATQPVEYFEKRPDGLFEHKVASQKPGVFIGAKLEEGVNGRIVLRDLELELSSVQKRKPLAGVGLNVGPPVFVSQKEETTISVKPDRYYGMELHTQEMGLLLVRLRVERVKGD